MLKKKLGNNSGMIMVVVTVFILVVSVLVIGILSRNVTQTLSVEEQVRRMRAEQVASGGFWRAYMTLSNGGAMPAGYYETIDGRNYTVTYTTAPGLNGTNEISVNVSY